MDDFLVFLKEVQHWKCKSIVNIKLLNWFLHHAEIPIRHSFKATIRKKHNKFFLESDIHSLIAQLGIAKTLS